MAFVDFTNPAACKWYQSKLADLVDLGVDVFKVSPLLIFMTKQSLTF